MAKQEPYFLFSSDEGPSKVCIYHLKLASPCSKISVTKSDETYLLGQNNPLLHCPYIRISRAINSRFMPPDNQLVEFCLSFQTTLQQFGVEIDHFNVLLFWSPLLAISGIFGSGRHSNHATVILRQGQRCAEEFAPAEVGCLSLLRIGTIRFCSNVSKIGYDRKQPVKDLPSLELVFGSQNGSTGSTGPS